jgi:hypothetical protein
MKERFHGSFSSDYETLSLVELLGEEEFSRFNSQPDLYGDLLARGILRRAGRAGFHQWRELRRDILGWQETSFRFTPLKKKIRLGLEKICEVIGIEKNVTLTLHDLKDRWRIDVRPTGRDSDLAEDYLAGFVQEFCSWTGLGKFYRVTIINADATHENEYSIVIVKAPIDD